MAARRLLTSGPITGPYAVADTATIKLLAGHLPNQSKECVMERLGISSQTWTKMKRGEPVRHILIERAIRRVETASP
jgi:hypothetical protein